MMSPASSLLPLLLTLLTHGVNGFQQLHHSLNLPVAFAPPASATTKPSTCKHANIRKTFLAAATDSASTVDPQAPQAVGTGYSQDPNLYAAIKEATIGALQALPSPLPQHKIDLGTVYVTSIYDSQFSPSQVVPAVLAEVKEYYSKATDNDNDNDDNDEGVLKKLIGCYSGGVVGSKLNLDMSKEENQSKTCSTFETEGLPGVVVTFCVLPDTKIQTFHVLGEDVPDDLGRTDLSMWKQSIGLNNVPSIEERQQQQQQEEPKQDDSPSFMLLPSPAFQNELDDFMRTMKMTFGPDQKMFGALASTVSSLSRARLFRYDVDEPGCLQTLADGCVGVSISGDVQFNVMVAPGTKPVGGIYRIIAGADSTIRAIQLDEDATQQLSDELEDTIIDDDDDDDDGEVLADIEAKKKATAALYAKAIIPKPVLAEANYIMKTLSDDDQAFMTKSLLVGIERNGGISKTPNELLRLAEGKGHSFMVQQVASAGMQDGAVTLPLGSVDVQVGAKMRFYVRDPNFAKKEIEALWTGYKKKTLEQSFTSDEEKKSSDVLNPAGCFFFPTLDRGTKYFGDTSYESNAITDYVPSLPSIGGFFCNGAIAALDENDNQSMVHGSASSYVLIGSKSNRPVYSLKEVLARNEASKVSIEEDIEVIAEDDVSSKSASNEKKPAPRSEDGELIVKRREVGSGRALSVSSVEWSVVENIAVPSSVLEGFMWDKETEVDRFRERVPLSNLASQCKLYDMDPSKPKSGDWAGALRRAAEGNNFVIVPELKRMEPKSGSLRKRYDLSKLTKQLVAAGSPAISVNCDAVLFGGSLEDVTTVREKISTSMLNAADADEGVVAPPILASDLILYPYQLYKLRLAGTDAVNMIVGALTSKDLLYLSKIAAILNLQMVASVSSEAQLRLLNTLNGGIHTLVISNRDMETFGCDASGEQALSLLKSEAVKEFKEKFGADIPILVEGRVGIIERDDEDGNPSTTAYIRALKDAGAMGAIVASGLVSDNKEDVAEVMRLMQTA